MLCLFIINLFTVRREYTAQDSVRATLSVCNTIENVRFQMMENRLYLGNYLLSGDLRDEDKTNKGVADLLAMLEGRRSPARTIPDFARRWRKLPIPKPTGPKTSRNK